MNKKEIILHHLNLGNLRLVTHHNYVLIENIKEVDSLGYHLSKDTCRIVSRSFDQIIEYIENNVEISIDKISSYSDWLSAKLSRFDMILRGDYGDYHYYLLIDFKDDNLNLEDS